MKKKTMKKKNSQAPKRAKNKEDIVELILEDHKPLKKLIAILKNDDHRLSQRKAAFEQFVPLLETHAHSEEDVLYTEMKDDSDFRMDSFEGHVEHALAEEMVMKTQEANKDEDMWTAHAKVLAELVEHHIQEEEEEVLPRFKKESSIDERVALGQKYAIRKASYENAGQSPVRYSEQLLSH